MLDDDRLLRLPDTPDDQRGLAVAAWSEPVVIRTYEPGEPDRYPRSWSTRVYQGSSGRVFPLPFHDGSRDEPAATRWAGLHLENEYVRLMVLPELGGRIHVGVDKTNGYDFFYRNNVIKPALVGLAGPWISRRRRVQLAAAPPPGHVPADRTGRSSRGRRLGHRLVLRPRPVRADEGHARHPAAARHAVIELACGCSTARSEPQTFLWWANVAAACTTTTSRSSPPT